MNAEDSKLYTIEFSERKDYLYAHVLGDEDNVKISEQYFHEVADECRRTKCSKVLIDENLKKSGSITDAYEVARELPKMGFLGIQIAFVDQYIEQSAINDFGVLAATNRGIYVKLFNSVEEAEKWLLSK